MREVTVVAIFFILLGASSLYFLSQSTLISPIQEDEIEDVGDVSESDVKPDVKPDVEFYINISRQGACGRRCKTWNVSLHRKTPMFMLM